MGAGPRPAAPGDFSTVPGNSRPDGFGPGGAAGQEPTRPGHGPGQLSRNPASQDRKTTASRLESAATELGNLACGRDTANPAGNHQPGDGFTSRYADGCRRDELGPARRRQREQSMPHPDGP